MNFFEHFLAIYAFFVLGWYSAAFMMHHQFPEGLPLLILWAILVAFSALILGGIVGLTLHQSERSAEQIGGKENVSFGMKALSNIEEGEAYGYISSSNVMEPSVFIGKEGTQSETTGHKNTFVAEEK
jgi:hypothetical protein